MELPSFPTPHSCQFCQKLVLDGLDLGRPSSSHGKAPRSAKERRDNASQDKPKYYFQNSTDFNRVVFDDCTLAAIKPAAVAGCSLCVYLLDEFNDASDPHTALIACVGLNVLYFGLTWSLDSVLPEERVVGVNIRYRASRRFQLISHADNAAAKYVPTRPINIRPASNDSFIQARNWLQTCLETHHSCANPSGKFMPTRVIEILQVRGRRYLRLRETRSEEAEPYVALSYCWGGEQRVTTDSKTVHRHLSRINMEDLPPTVRDAVFVAEKLGITRLWVDALSIIQDDIHDKAFEISQMPLASAPRFPIRTAIENMKPLSAIYEGALY